MACAAAEVDLRVGGRYRIANRLPDGQILWISGEFEAVERPHRLVYTWHVGNAAPVPTAAPAAAATPAAAAAERVTVTFESRGEETEVIVAHERIPTAAMRDMHEQGWMGCLDGLVNYLKGPLI